MLPACCSSSAYITGSGFVCARQKWVVCARQTVGRLCTFLLCVFVIVSLQHDSSSSFFLNISRAAFVCHLVELLSCSLTEVHPSSFTQLISQLTQLISHNSTHLTTHRTHLTPLRSSYNSHNSSHLTSHTTHLTQLISHNSSYTTQLTQELLSCAIWWSCFRVLSLKFTQVLSHNSSHNSHNSSHTTPLISQLTELVSHHSTHLTTHTTRLISQVTQLISHKSSLNNSSYTATPHPTGN